MREKLENIGENPVRNDSKNIANKWEIPVENPPHTHGKDNFRTEAPTLFAVHTGNNFGVANATGNPTRREDFGSENGALKANANDRKELGRTKEDYKALESGRTKKDKVKLGDDVLQECACESNVCPGKM